MRTIKETRDALSKGEISNVELAKEYLDNIEKKDGEIHSYLEVYDDVIEQAEKVKDGVLSGIPISIKDNILIKGKTTSAASKILENYKAVYDATAIEKLKEAGAIFIGRTNMDEFAMGGSTENSAYGPTKNPHDIERVPGGSSGGSAASVSADLALASIGSDTGGSIRQPSAFCGVVGLKPTYGRVSRYGLMAMGSSLDQIGPIANSVSDVEIIYNIIKGKDDRDGTTISDNTYQKRDNVKKIGVPHSILEMDGLDSKVADNFKKAVDKLKELGYEIVDVSFEHLSLALATYYIIMPAEVSSNMARYDGVKYGYRAEGETLEEVYQNSRSEGLGDEVKRRIMLGTYVLSTGYFDEYYGKANMARAIIREDFNRVFSNVDIIAMPTTPSPAWKIGEKINNPVEMYLADIFTVPANIAGVPAISIPSGKVDNLPVGLQLIAPHGCEDSLFEVGKEFSGENIV